MQFIFPITFSLFAVSLGSGLLVYSLIIGTSIFCLQKGDRYLVLALFFVLLYLLPYGLNLLLGHSWGAYLDNNFLAGLPLYTTLPLYFNKWSPINKNLKFIFIVFLVAFLVSTVIPGFLSFIGLGGYRVRIAWTFTYFNSFLVGILAYSVFTSERNIIRFTNLIMLLAIFAAAGGLLQYVFGPLFADPSTVLQNRLFIIPSTNAVSLFPYFIVPFSFALNQISSQDFRKKSLAQLTVSILIIASILTWSRWGMLVLLIMVLIHLMIIKKSLNFMFSLSIVIFTVLLIVFIINNLQMIPVDEMNRFSSATSLYTRITLWGMGLSLLSDVWLFGVGIGNTVKTLYSYSPHPIFKDFYYPGFNFNIVQSLHHFFLDWFINQGITAMLGLAGLYYYIIKHFRFGEKYFYNDVLKRFSRSILLALLGLTLYWMQNSGDGYYYLFLFLGSSFAIRKLAYILHIEEILKTGERTGRNLSQALQ